LRNLARARCEYAGRVSVSLALLLIALIVPAAACSGGDTEAEQEPPWVQVGIERVTDWFVGKPVPVETAWGVTNGRRWVAVRFSQVHVCGSCSSPRGAVVRGSGGRITFAPGTMRMVSFSTGFSTHP
jgi:hypothetical protein